MKKQTRQIFKILAAIMFMLLFVSLFTVMSFAARLPGDMNNDGKITAADARIVLRISAKLDSIENYMDEPSVTPEPGIPVEVNFEIDYSITDDGYFVGGESTATISVTPDADLVSAELKIVDVTGDTVYSAKLDNMKKGQSVPVEWDGKTNSGAYANSGDYSVIITAGENEETVEGLNFTAKNYFSAGNGSEAHPFLVASKEDFENIVRFPKAYFKQTKDIDYNYSETKSMFTNDVMFNGTYDGNGKAFSNILTNNPLFNYVGENGTVKNVMVKDSSFSCASALVLENYGTISNCNVSANLTQTADIHDQHMGLITKQNSGLIANCSAQGVISGSNGAGDMFMKIGGIAGVCDGKIISCIADVDITAKATSGSVFAWQDLNVGEIAGYLSETGFIQNCEGKGTVAGSAPRGVAYLGGIAGYNSGQINNSVYTGESKVNIAGGGNGIVA